MEIKFKDKAGKVHTIIEQDKKVYANVLEYLRENGWGEKGGVWKKYN